MRNPGKKVGTKIYVHRRYEETVVDKQLLAYAKRLAGCIDGYDCVRYDTKDGAVAFQFADDFNGKDEPAVMLTVTVKQDGTVTRNRSNEDNPPIWHHKWLWVRDDYKGFDVEESKARSKTWEPHVSKEEKRKIGRKSFWESIRKRWETV